MIFRNKRELFDELYGIIFIIIATVLWGSSFAVRKIGMVSIGPLMMNGCRFFAAFVFMTVIFIFRARLMHEYIMEFGEIKRQIKIGVIIGIFYAVGAVFQQIGLNSVSAGETGFITSLYSVMVPFLAWFIFKTKISFIKWIAVCFSGLGLYFVTDGGMSVSPGMFILLVGALCFAVQIILIAKFVNNNDPLLLVTVQLGLGTVVNVIIAFISGENFELAMISDSIVPILYTGIMSLGLANLCQFIGQKKVTPTVAAITCSFESVFGMIFGVVLLNETITWMKTIGGIMILTAVVLSQIRIKE